MAERGEKPNVLYLVPKLQEFWREGRFTDVTITVQTREFRCHRLVLTAFSRVFGAMLRTNMREGLQRRVQLGGVTAFTFQQVLDFMYGSELRLDDTSALDLLQASDLLDVPSLKLRCAAYFAKRLTSQNCLSLWALARLHDCLALAKDARVCALKHFRKASKTSDFLLLEFDQLESLLKDDSLSTPAEEEAFYALCSWVVKEPKLRTQHVDHLLGYVRFPLIDPTLLNESIARRVVALRSARGRELLREAQEYHVTADLRHLLTSPRTEPRADSPYMAAIVVIGNQLGGEGCFTALAYSLQERVWRTTSRRLELAVGCAVCPWGPGFYVAGGLYSAQVLFYDLRTSGPMEVKSRQATGEPCNPCADMPRNLIHHGLLAFGHRLLLFGGWRWQAQGSDDSPDGNPSVWEYSTRRDEWQLAGRMINGRERILGHVRDGQRILAYSTARGLTLKYFHTVTRQSGVLTFSLADLSRRSQRALMVDVFDVCPFLDRHVLVTGRGDVLLVHVGPEDDVSCQVSQIPLSQDMNMFSMTQVRGKLYVLGGIFEKGSARRESTVRCEGLEHDLTVVKVPGPYWNTWAYSTFYMNVSKSRFQRVLSGSAHERRQAVHLT